MTRPAGCRRQGAEDRGTVASSLSGPSGGCRCPPAARRRVADPLDTARAAASAVVVAGAGSKIAQSGDELAEERAVCRLFVGMLLVALVASLREFKMPITARCQRRPTPARRRPLRRQHGQHRRSGGDRPAPPPAGVAQRGDQARPGGLRRHRAHRPGGARRASPPGISVGWWASTRCSSSPPTSLTVAWMRRSPVSQFRAGRNPPPADRLVRPTGPRRTAGRRRRPLRPVARPVRPAALVILAARPLLARSAEASRTGRAGAPTFMGTLFAQSRPRCPSWCRRSHAGAHQVLRPGRRQPCSAATFGFSIAAPARHRPRLADGRSCQRSHPKPDRRAPSAPSCS